MNLITNVFLFCSGEDDVRLSFPVKEGVILPPFQLQHSVAVTNQAFQIKAAVIDTLMSRTDLDIQLKCFLNNDNHMTCNWPQKLQISVNSKTLPIDRGDNKLPHPPLYLKNYIHAGRNNIQITVFECCCVSKAL